MDIEKIRQINPSIIKEDGTIQSFKEQLFDLEHGKYDFRYPMFVSDTSEYIKFLGNEDIDKPVLINPQKILEITREHFLTISDFADLKQYFTESGLAFDSLTHETSRVIVIDKEDAVGDQVIAACRLDATQSYLSVNQVSSIYGKENFEKFVERTYEADKTFYCNEKTESFIQSPRLQLPNGLKSALSISNYKGSFTKSQIDERIISSFRKKTEALFSKDAFDGLSSKEIEGDVEEYIRKVLADEILSNDIEIKDVIITGSRSRGLESSVSDLDVVLAYTGSEKEDVLFNALNVEPLKINGIRVDINPIRPEQTGALSDYLFKVDEHLEKKRVELDMADNISHSFIDDREKMNDFFILTKEEFLSSYSYLNEDDYEKTLEDVNKGRNIFEKGSWGIEYIDDREGYRVYQIDHPQNTVAYKVSIEEAREEAEKREIELHFGSVEFYFDGNNNRIAIFVPGIESSDPSSVREPENNYGFDIVFYDKSTDDGFITHILNKHKINDMECFFSDGFFEDGSLVLRDMNDSNNVWVNKEIFSFLSNEVFVYTDGSVDLLTLGEEARYNELKSYFETDISGYLGVELTDDSSDHGGTSFRGETVEDFALDVGFNSNTPLYLLNRALEENGIKPINLSGDPIDKVVEKIKASEFAEFFEFYLDFNENPDENAKYQVTDNQGVFHTRYINNVSELAESFDSMLMDYVDTTLEEHGFEYFTESPFTYYEQAKRWIENEDRYASKDAYGSLYGTDTYKVICSLVDPDNIIDDLDIQPERMVEMQNRLDIERLYTLDEVYEEADGKAHLSPELKRKDEALIEFTDWLHDNGYMDERSAFDSWEDAMDHTVKAWNISALFSENGTLLYVREGDTERLNSLEKDYIYELSDKQINDMLDDFSNDKPSLPEGLFYEKGKTVFTAIDNSGGEMYMEDFKTYYSMVHYLEGEDTDTLHEREREWESGLDGGRTVIQLFRHEIEELKHDNNLDSDSEVFERFRNETFTKDDFFTKEKGEEMENFVVSLSGEPQITFYRHDLKNMINATGVESINPESKYALLEVEIYSSEGNAYSYSGWEFDSLPNYDDLSRCAKKDYKEYYEGTMSEDFSQDKIDEKINELMNGYIVVDVEKMNDFRLTVEKEESEMEEKSVKEIIKDKVNGKENEVMANEMEKNGVTVENPEGEKPGVKKVYIALNKKFCNQTEDKFEEWKLFNTMAMPKGTVLNGQDISGYTIHPKFMNESQKNDKMMVATYYVNEGETLEIKLNKEGLEAQKVNVEELKAAVDTQKQQYAEQMQEQEKQKELQKANEQNKEKDAGEEI